MEFQGFRSLLQPSRFSADASEPRGARAETTLFPAVSCRHIENDVADTAGPASKSQRNEQSLSPC